MELYEKGYITDKDTGGIALNWGDGDAMLEMVRLTAVGEGFGKKLGQGSYRLAESYGHPELSMTVKKQEMPAYALRVVKDQPKLAAAADPGAQPLEWTQGHGWVRTENYRSSSIADFLVIEQIFHDRPLLDQTQLTGRYDFSLSYSYGDAANQDPDAPPPLFTAIKDQLGLKFEAVKAPVDVMVIDQITRPTPN